MVEQFWYDVLILPEYILFVTAASHFHVSFSFLIFNENECKFYLWMTPVTKFEMSKSVV